jgi:phosphoglycolate phosphatase-like HAD superfamily hydrolase
MIDSNELRLIAFDLDGTLIQHYYPVYCREAVRLFPHLGSESITFEQAIEAFREERLFDFFPHSTREECETKFWNLWDRTDALCPVLLPGTIKALSWFKEHGMTMTLVTSRIESITEVEKVLKEIGIAEYFDLITSLHGRTHSWMDKSSMILDACKALNFTPRETIYFGDHPTDMKSARTINSTPIGVLTGGIGVEKLSLAGASMVLDSVEKVMDHLEFQNGRMQFML